ncbi:cupin-like domain-containing protein [Duganella sp. Root336D2]|uniref:cupin-like domain-containing protein n=1 Tax=Duganella sp. Root336D2 TaxID=1736518 RepID=UPI0006FEBF2D|nr:cupin-like domain-containing protein [Duganella sp. Root336D2]KQV45944.1 transcription factor [Duganella sp. Root336D2]
MTDHQPPDDPAPGAQFAASRLPPLQASRSQAADDAAQAAKAEARERRDAEMRGVSSMQEMRESIRTSARALPAIDAVPRVRPMSATAFRTRAREGLPFLIPGAVARWPICALGPEVLRERFGDVHVRARVGDYIGTAFAPDRAMLDTTMREYLDLAAVTEGLPPYLGNLELRELNSLCHWPTYFEKMGPPRFWIGPAGTVTPLHSDFDDNIFAQVWGTKRIFLSPPHHDEFLYSREANPVLFGSPFDPESPDFERYPLARQATMIEVIVQPGDMLYVPAGWYHQVRALTFSLSSNRWARGLPYALHR